MGEMDEVVVEFLAESREGLDQLDRDLVALEESPTDTAILSRVFRCAHTIKGTAGFLGFSRLESVTHAGESLLARLRDGELTVTPEITSGLLGMVDAVRGMLGDVEAAGNDGSKDHAALVDTLHRLTAGEAVAAQPAPVAAPLPAAAAQPGVPVASASPVPSPELASPETAPAGAPAAAEGAGTEAGPPAPTGAGHNETVRVDVELINRLMDLAGELVLTRNQILQIQASSEDPTFTTASQRLNLITAELQEGIMRMRMMPIDNVLSKFPRIVRDVARACKKQARVEIDGKNTELDKTLIEAIKDPLTHLIRNAVDHGIEPPDERLRRGKAPEGLIQIRAFHESGQVHVEICDDGGGIAIERVRQKALSRGLVAPDQLARMSEDELCGLIFLPGFSTAEQVTNVSGRGVGMDVVKTNVEKIGGTVSVSTRLGEGSTFRLKIPLTLAIVPALIVAAGRGRFAIPQVSLVELVGFDPLRDSQKIESFHGAPVFRLRDQLLPLVYLDKEIGQASSKLRAGSVHIAVLQIADRRFGLVVDRVIDQQEIVVKPLARQASGVPLFAGATILGDGRVALILDVLGLAQQTRIVSDLRNGRPSAAQAPVRQTSDELQTMLLLKSPDDGRMALPLELVSRLETVPRDAVERVGDQDVLRYGDDIMPLVSVAEVIPERRTVFRREEPTDAAPAEPLNVVVVHRSGVAVGLIVEDILDVVDISIKSRRVGSRPGIEACVVINDRVTELLDLDWVLQSVAIREEAPRASA